VALCTGSGHVLYWVTLPEGEADRFTGQVLPRVAGDHPLHETALEWRHLLPGAGVHAGTSRNV
jgi:hypothetical protein